MAERGGLFANVTEAGDIVLLAGLLAATLVVGLILLALDTVVRHLREKPRKRNAGAHERSSGGGGVGGRAH